ncbi:MAG: RidA family protein [Acidobacteriaceae bacterium]
MKTIFLVTLGLVGAISLSAQTEFINPKGLAAAHGYTHVITTKPGKMVFISGQVAMDREGHLVGKGDLRAQTKQVFENLKTALTAAGATFDDVVKITWYVKGYNPSFLSTLRDVRDEYVKKEAPPTSTLVGVTSLFQDDYLLEVDAVAVIAQKQ